MTVVEYLKDSVWINFHNISVGTAKKIINGMGHFNIVVNRADDDQLDDVVNNTEIRFIDGDLSFYGVVRRINGESRLSIEGTDYSYLANKKMLKESSCPNSDSGLSDDYTVVYTSEAGRNIIYDIAQTCGFTADSSSVDVFPDLNIKFRNIYGLEALKTIQKQTSAYWYIDENKKLYFKSTYGSTSETSAFNLGDNAELKHKSIDDERRCTKALVWGSNGASGSYTDALYTSGEEYEGRFKFDDLRRDSECDDRAEEIVKSFRNEILILTIRSPVQGYDMGDNVLITGRKLDGTYRITSIELDIQGQRTLDITNSGLDHRTETPEEVYEKLMKRSSSDVSNIVTGDSYDELIFNSTGATSTNNFLKLEIYIDPAKVSDVLDSKLYIVRDYVKKIYGDSTSSANADISQTDHEHNQNYFGESDHLHSITGLASDPVISGLGENVSNMNTDLDTGESSYSWSNISMPNFGGPNVGTDGIHFHVGVESFTNEDIYVYIRVPLGGGRYYPSIDGIRLRIFNYSSQCVDFTLPINAFGLGSISDDLDYRVETTGGSAIADNITFNVVFFDIPGHTHWIDLDSSLGEVANFTSKPDTDGDPANLIDSGHANPLDVDIKQYDDGASKTIGVYVDGVSAGNITLSSIGDDDTLDLSSFLNTSGFHTIELRPNGNTYLSAGTKVKVFKIE